MPIATQTTTAPAVSTGKVLKLRATGAQEPEHIKQLRDNGFAVVPKVLKEDQAARYVQRANEWLQAFGKGFDPKDRSTWYVPLFPSALGVFSDDQPG